MSTERKAGNGGFRRKIAAVLVAGGVLLAGALGFASQQGSANTTAANTPPVATTQHRNAPATVPKPLENVGHYGENAYDKAKLGDWTKARSELASLKSATAQLQGAGVSNTSTLKADVAALDRAVFARDQAGALAASNKVTFDAASLSASYKTPVPVEVTKLDYYGRQLEVQAAAGNTSGLKQTATDIQNTWNQVRPQIVANGGTKEAKQFDATVAQVQQAQTPSQYGKLATPVLAQVDYLEAVFG